jgi:hypothetical protein
MKVKLIITTLMIVAFSMSGIAQKQDSQKEKDLIKEVIQNAYVDGLCNNADTAAVNRGFHPGFTMFGIGRGNTMMDLKIHNWIEYAKDGKRSGLKYSFQNEFTTIKFEFVDVAGTAAVAKIDFYEGAELKFIDYLTLLKFASGWKIVSKIYYPVPKEESRNPG